MCHVDCNHLAFSWLSFNYVALANIIHHLYKEQGQGKTGTRRAQNWLYFRVDFAAASASGPWEEWRGQGGNRPTKVAQECCQWPLHVHMGQGHHGEVVKTACFFRLGLGTCVLRELVSEEEQGMEIEGRIKTKIKKREVLHSLKSQLRFLKSF